MKDLAARVLDALTGRDRVKEYYISRVLAAIGEQELEIRGKILKQALSAYDAGHDELVAVWEGRIELPIRVERP